MPATGRAAVGLLFAVAVAARACFLLVPGLNSDQAVIGLMGRHILAGEFPVFFWGEPTSGTAESFLAAAVFAVFGASRYTLNLVPALLSLGFVWACWRLGREVAGERGGLIALALGACPPVLLTWNSVLARGNYVESLALGTLCLVLGLRLAAAEPTSVEGRRLALSLGGVAGLAWYMSPQSVHYVLTVALYLLWRQRLRVLETLRLALPAFLVASLPFWLANVGSGFASFDEMRRYAALAGVSEGARQLAGYLPVLVGAAGFSDMPERLRFPAAPLLGPLAGAIVAAGIGAGIAVGMRRRTPGVVLLALFPLVTLVVILLGGVPLSDDARYLLPLYSAGLPLLAAGLAWCWRWRPLAIAALSLVLVSNAYGHGRFLVGELARFPGDRANDAALFDFLRARGATHAFAPEYWLSYRLTFDAREEILVASPFWGRHARAIAKYPEYTERVRAHGPSAYVFWADVAPFRGTLDAAGIGHEAARIGRYTVLHGFHPPPPLRSLPSSGWRVGALSGRLAFDRDPWTAWRGTELALDLGAVSLVSQVSLLLGPTAFEPVGVRIEGSEDGRHWTTLATAARLVPGLAWAGAKLLLEEHGRVALAWAPRPVRYLRIGRDRDREDWSLAEVFVFEGGNAPVPPDLTQGLRLEADRAWGDALERYGARLLDDPDEEPALTRMTSVAAELGLGGLDAVYDALAARTMAWDPGLALRFARRLFAIAPHREVAWQRLAGALRATGGSAEAEAVEAGRSRHFAPTSVRQVGFGRDVKLVGYDLVPSRIEAGDTVELRSYWQLRHPIRPGLRVSVEVHDSRRVRLALDDRALVPGLRDPVERWESVREDFTLRVPARLDAGTYAVRVAVWDRPGHRLRVWESWWPTRARVAAVGPIHVRTRSRGELAGSEPVGGP